jgi:flagellar biosynthesis protein FlhB
MTEKTEAPTPRRLADARKEGQVARSMELNAAVALLVGSWLLLGPGKQMAVQMGESIVLAVSSLPSTNFDGPWLQERILTDLSRLLPALGGFLLTLLVTGLATSVAQTGLLWSGKKIGFDLNRINPLSGFKRLFSSQGLIELVRALAKLVIVGWVSYSYLRTRLTLVLGTSQQDFSSATGSWVNLATGLMLQVGGAYFLLAIVDYAYQRWQHMRTLRMSIQEVKEEMKHSEGDPFMRARIRAEQRRIARMRMMSNVPKADVIVTNPTHLAIALKYSPESMQAPKVLAKGAHKLAERIIEVARGNHIPVMQNIPLAHALYKTVEVDQEIPPELYIAVAEVLAYVYKLRKPGPAVEAR